MNSLVKQRLVGILVILSVAAIFWPLIFAPHEYPKKGDFVEVPPVPKIEKALETNLKLGEHFLKEEEYSDDWTLTKITESGDGTTDIRKEKFEIGDEVSSLGRTRTVPPEKPRLDSKGIPIAFVLQVVSMADDDRAKKVRDTLLEAGHKAYLRQVKIAETVMYRVYVGPKFEKLRLIEVKPEIDKIFTVDSVILRYVP